jgi:hypothetical protein
LAVLGMRRRVNWRFSESGDMIERWPGRCFPPHHRADASGGRRYG